MKDNNGNRGFTLVELLITVAILALIVAPFLATFVMASGNNLNASQKENAAHLAEDIAEEIKAKSLEVLEAEYDNGVGGDAYDDTTGEYTFDIPSSKLPAGIKSGFSAVATLKPSTSSSINDPMPTLSNMSGTDTMLLMSAFYANDRYADTTFGATYRYSYINVSYDASKTEPYHVSLKVEYYSAAGKEDEKVISEADFAEKPSVYAIYTPMSTSDMVFFENELEEEYMEDAAGDIIPVDFYFSVQDDSSLGTATINPANVHISDVYGTTGDIRSYITGTGNKYTNIHTNMSFTPAIAGYESSLVASKQSNKLYDLEVVVSYEGTQCAKFVSSKLKLS